MKKGFTLIELLIVVVILMLLMLIVLIGWKVQINRAHDSLRKKNLNDIKRVFEEYYNDKGCYPPTTVMDDVSDCGSANLAPYLTAVPCDPDTKTPYYYIPIDANNLCLGYRAFAGLKDTGDTDITAQGCNGVTGCGYGSGWNYGISSGAPVAAPGFDPGTTPTPTQGSQPGKNACSPTGVCNSYSNPAGSGCPKSWATDCTENGVNQCQFLANRCSN